MLPHPHQRPLPSSNVREVHLAAPSVATLVPDGLCPNTEARPTGRTGDEDDLGYRRRMIRPSCHHLKDEEAPTATQDTPRPTNFPVPTAAAAATDNENASVKKRSYRRHRSTTDIIFAARQLQKKCPEMRIHLYSTFMYRTEVFETSHASTIFVDDCALTPLQRRTWKEHEPVRRPCDNFGLVINTEKMVFKHTNSPIVDYNAPTVNLKDAHPQAVDNLTYLGSTPSRNTKIENEIACRISKASQEFGCLQNSLESSRSSPWHETKGVQTSHPAKTVE
nr:unnamed protein product [Spirometra erinaceieuropaei]